MVAAGQNLPDKSPKPFQEPDNMVTIDLNKEDYIKDTSTAEETPKNACSKATKFVFFIALGTVLSLLFLATCVVFLNGTHRNTTNSTSRQMPLWQRTKENFLRCNKTQAMKHCCYIFFKNKLEKCAWDNVLHFFIKYELESIRRYKRQNVEDANYAYSEQQPPHYEYNEPPYYYNLGPDPNLNYNPNEKTYPPEPFQSYSQNVYAPTLPEPELGTPEQKLEKTKTRENNSKKRVQFESYALEQHQAGTTEQKVENIEPPVAKTRENSQNVYSPTLVEPQAWTPKQTAETIEPSGAQTRVNSKNERISSLPFDKSSDDMQSVQPVKNNRCILTLPRQVVSPLRTPSGFELNPMYNTMSNIQSFQQQQPLYVVNPSIYSYLPFQYPSYSNINNQIAVKNSVQIAENGGQYFLCNPLGPASNNVAGLQGVEVREAYSLQDQLENLPKTRRSNKTREAIDCPIGQRSCSDGSKCINQRQFCDNEVNCKDGSDEIDCSCASRVGEIRTCDGYLDCPNGEDEQNCFDCGENEMSCDDWSRFQPGTCFLISQRCDGIKHCEITGKDEEDCAILSDKVGQSAVYKISNAAGFLHRNYKGTWYPTCLGVEYLSFDVCKIEAGPSDTVPPTRLVPINNFYSGQYLDISHTGEVVLSDTCIENKAAYVECPPMFCGLRLVISNPFRASEIDTSAEELLNNLQRFSKLRVADSRVVGGKPSQPTSWPWIVSIYKNGIFHCGGVIINELWILTAAHCVDRFWFFYYEIQAGMLRRYSYSPMEQIRFATVAIPHEKYSKKSLKNDIALMKLSKPIRFNRYVRPICLPSEATAGADYLKGPKPNSICLTVGWGATIEHGTDPDNLREVEIPILSYCKHAEDREGDEICAGLFEGGRDACQGDSGGPLMCQNPRNNNQWYLAGVVSHGEGCARPNEPGVYTKVSKYSGWISENINGKTTGRTPLQKCPSYVCHGTQKCLPKKRRCDKVVDCLFGDDELDCWAHNGANLPQADLVGSARNWFPDLVQSRAPPKPITRVEDKSNDTIPDKFHCENMFQVIPWREKCDKIVNCEDATDETNCSCVDYLEKFDPNAICDAITDCKDLSDENNCSNCTDDEFFCRQDQICIPLRAQCDGKDSCGSGEDEWNCVALTDGKTLTFDSDLLPTQHMKGVITINSFGVWRPLCTNTDDAASIAGNVCNLLGFEDYTVFHKISIADQPLNVTIDGSLEPAADCVGLYIVCTNITATYTHDLQDKISFSTLPWSAMIYTDGQFQCTGSILNLHWILAPQNCLSGHQNSYIAVLLGKGKSDFHVEGPHEQTIPITQFASIKRNNVVLLRTGQQILFNRYVRPTPIKNFQVPMWICALIVGTESTSEVIFLEIERNCTNGLQCFKPMHGCSAFPISSGIISCHSKDGWFPAFLFHNFSNSCDFSTQKLASINATEVLPAMAGQLRTISPANCPNFRCSLGNCISNHTVCDGLPNCRDGSDEDFEFCRRDRCPHGHECGNSANVTGCVQSEFKCRNGACIPKASFCDSVKDCGDGSDEPEVCSCTSFLEAVHPEKVCDGTPNCLDHSDENPKTCKCGGNRNITCGRSDLCVSADLVCDGFEDCPNGEDESSCYSLRSSLDRTHRGEVMRRTAGIWHSGCFTLKQTTSSLEEICQRLGFTGGSAYQLQNLNATRPLSAVLDRFDALWLRRGAKQFMVRFRTGNSPYMALREDPACHKLYIECL